jgi:hypothetical protein
VESEPDALFTSLANMADLEEFMHELHERLGDRELKHGDDLTAWASDLGIRVPEFLAGEPMVYEVHDRKAHGIEGPALVLVRPSGITNPVAELKIFCGRWGATRSAWNAAGSGAGSSSTAGSDSDLKKAQRRCRSGPAGWDRFMSVRRRQACQP